MAHAWWDKNVNSPNTKGVLKSPTNPNTNWWDTPAYAAIKAVSGSGVLAKPVGNNNGSANASEYALGLTKSAPRTSSAGSTTPRTPSQSPPPTVDYNALARQIYEPSLDYLGTQEKISTSRNKANDAQLASMYNNLVNSIAGDTRTINADYGKSISDVARGTRAAVDSIGNIYSKSAAEQAAMLKMLGIQAAAPDTLAPNARDKAFFQSMASTSGKSVADMLISNRATGQEYNTAQKNIARQTGVDARASNKLKLQDTLNQIMGQRANLETTINSQAQQMQANAIKQLQSQLAAQEQQANSDRNFAMQQARLALDTSKFKVSSSAANATPAAKDPWGKLEQLASTLYPNQVATGNAVKAIQDTVTQAASSGQYTWQSPVEFINAVLSRNRGAKDSKQLMQLATYAYQQMFG